MISLNQFYEVIEVAERPLDPEYKAYRMDNGSNKPDMRRYLNLGTCHTCDYFLVSKNIVLIEEKRLSEKTKEIEKEVCYLNSNDKEGFVCEKILQSLRLKVYGSLLVLSRLMLQYGEFAHLVGKKPKHDFWFVDSSVETRHMRYVSHIKNRLLSDLRTLLTGEFIEDVAIMRPEELKYKLDNAPNP